MSNIQIRGGAGVYEAAAVVAVVDTLLAEDDTARAQVPRPPVPSAWVRVGMAAPFGRFNPDVVAE